MPPEELTADEDPVAGRGHPPEPLVVLIAAMGPRRVDGAGLIKLAGEQGVGRDGWLAPARAEVCACDGVRLRDARGLRANPGAVGVAAPEAVVNRLHAACHATGTAVLQGGDRPAHPVTREDDVAVHERDEVARGYPDGRVALEVGVTHSRRRLQFVNRQPRVTEFRQPLPGAVSWRADQDDLLETGIILVKQRLDCGSDGSCIVPARDDNADPGCRRCPQLVWPCRSNGLDGPRLEADKHQAVTRDVIDHGEHGRKRHVGHEVIHAQA